jgi:UDP-N-acetylglucosamine 2-epimerase (non-hydrolysing)
VFVVGNTIVDAIQQNFQMAQTEASILSRLGIRAGEYLLATSHRQESVDDKNRFSGLIAGLQLVQRAFGVPLVYPIHPRARKQLERFGLDSSGLLLVEPVDYLAFLQLESKAKLVLTDSGGVQEEACILSVPCVIPCATSPKDLKPWLWNQTFLQAQSPRAFFGRQKWL